MLARIDTAGQRASVQQAVAVLDAALIAQARAEDALARAEALGADIARTELEAAGRALQTATQDVARPGRVDFVSQRVDAATGGLSVRLGFDTPVRAPVGLTVTTGIIVDERAEAITVPRAAIAETPEGAVVFVVRDGIAEERAVTIIDWPAARLIVTEGLALGEVLITDATGLSDGQAVRGTVR